MESNKKTAFFSMLISSLKMALGTFSSRIFGLVRDLSMAYVFGASGITDAFFVAYRIPNLLRELFAEGAFSSAFVPIFTEVNIKDKAEARKLLWSLFVLLLIVTGIISIGIIVFAKELVFLNTSSVFQADIEKINLTITLVKIMAPFLTLISLAALFMGVLNSLKVFFIPAFAPVFFNISMIISIIFVPPILRENGIHEVFALAFGVVAGGLLQMLFQFPVILKKNFGPTFQIKLITKHTIKIISRVGIGAVGVAAYQINVVINNMLATGIDSAASWLQYSSRLFQLPIGILGVSIAGSNLVHFSNSWKRGEKEDAVTFLKTSYDLSLTAVFWALALLAALSTPLVHLIFERGAFDRSDTLMTAYALSFYLIGLPAYALYKVFAPTFFAIDKPRVSVYISVFSIGINVIFCLSLTPIYGFKILAIGVALSMIINTVIKAYFLKKYLLLNYNFFINPLLFKILLSSVISFVLAYYLRRYLFNFNDIFYKKVIVFILISVASTFVYASTLFLFGEGRGIKRFLRIKSK